MIKHPDGKPQESPSDEDSDNVAMAQSAETLIRDKVIMPKRPAIMPFKTIISLPVASDNAIEEEQMPDAFQPDERQDE